MNNYYQNDEAEIDLIGLCIYVLRQWRRILVFFLIGAVLGCGISFFRLNQIKPGNIEGYLSSLDAEDINEDEVRQYADYQALYDAALAHGDSSVVLNMDQNNVWSAQIRYFLTSDYNSIDAVVSYYNALLYQGNNLEDLLTASGLSCSSNDIIELVSVNCGKVGLDNQILGDSKVLETRNANLTINISAPSEDCLRQMFEQAETMVDASIRTLSAQYSSLQNVLLSESSSFGYSAAVAAQQASYLSNRRDILKNITDAEKNLSDDEKLYYTCYFDEDFPEEYEYGFSKKWPVIAAVVLAFLAACWYAVKYIFDNHIKSEEALSRQFKLQVLGSIDVRPAAGNGIDRLLNRLEAMGQISANSTDYLRAVLQGLDAEPLAVLFDKEDPAAKDLADKLVSADSRLVSAGDLLSEEGAAESVRQSKGALLITHLNVTTNQELLRTLELSAKFGREILGSIVIR